MEYALGMDPNVCSRQGLPVYDASGEYLRITFVRRVGAPDVLYLPESGGDLSEGFGPDVTEVYVSPEDSDGLQTVVVEDNTPIDAAACRFMRLKLQSIP